LPDARGLIDGFLSRLLRYRNDARHHPRDARQSHHRERFHEHRRNEDKSAWSASRTRLRPSAGHACDTGECGRMMLNGLWRRERNWDQTFSA
jgi:hypothetical protein